MARCLGLCLRRTGANVDYERVAPHLYAWGADGACREAYMDIWCSWPGALANTKVDVTIRSPFARRYKHTSSVPSVAADAGARDKERRYGTEVWTLNYESRGRLGAQGIELLQHLACEANCWSQCMQKRLTSTWRSRLERVLLQGQAEGLLLCLGARLECINGVARMGRAGQIAVSAQV